MSDHVYPEYISWVNVLREFIHLIQNDIDSPRLEELLRDNNLSTRVADEIRHDPGLKAEIVMLLESRIASGKEEYQDSRFESIKINFANAMAGGTLNLTLRAQLAAHPSIIEKLEHSFELAVTGNLGQLIENYKKKHYTSQCHLYHDVDFCLAGAAGYGDIEAVKRLLKDPEIIEFGNAMVEAAKGGHLQVVELLFADGRVGSMTYAASEAARYGHQEVLRFLLDNNRDINVAGVYYGTAMGGQTAIIEFLLNEYPGQPEYGDLNMSLQVAVVKGHLDVFRMLLYNPRVNNLDSAMIALAKNPGYSDIFIALLGDPRVTHLESVLNILGLKGYENNKFLIDHLLTDRRIFSFQTFLRNLVAYEYQMNPSHVDLEEQSQNMDLIRYVMNSPKALNISNVLNLAAEFDDIVTVEYLLNNPILNTKIKYIDKAAGTLAARNRVALVKRLLEDKRYANPPRILSFGIEKNHPDIVRLVLDTPNWSHIYLQNILNYGAKYGYLDIVKWVLSEKRYVNLDRAAQIAADNGQTEVADLVRRQATELARTKYGGVGMRS